MNGQLANKIVELQLLDSNDEESTQTSLYHPHLAFYTSGIIATLLSASCRIVIKEAAVSMNTSSVPRESRSF
jgi:hypothetical protein